MNLIGNFITHIYVLFIMTYFNYIEIAIVIIIGVGYLLGLLYMTYKEDKYNKKK